MLSYPVINLPRRANLGQSEPIRYIPAGPVDCSSVSEYQKAVDNAAERIAYYQKLIQDAASSGNQGGVDQASVGSDLANRDWQAWSKVVKDCGSPAPKAAASSSKMPIWIPIAIAGVVGLVVVGSFTGFPKSILK